MWSRMGRTQLLPFSTGAKRRSGNRLQRPCPISVATVSMMGRPWWPTMAAKPDPPLNGSISP